MPMGTIFWVIMLIWLIFGVGLYWYAQSHFFVGSSLMIFILFLLLGWHAFGPPIR